MEVLSHACDSGPRCPRFKAHPNHAGSSGVKCVHCSTWNRKKPPPKLRRVSPILIHAHARWRFHLTVNPPIPRPKNCEFPARFVVGMLWCRVVSWGIPKLDLPPAQPKQCHPNAGSVSRNHLLTAGSLSVSMFTITASVTRSKN